MSPNSKPNTTNKYLTFSDEFESGVAAKRKWGKNEEKLTELVLRSFHKDRLLGCQEPNKHKKTFFIFFFLGRKYVTKKNIYS